MILLNVIGRQHRPRLRELAEEKLQRLQSGKLKLLIEPFGTEFDEYYNDPRFAGLVRNQLDVLLR